MSNTYSATPAESIARHIAALTQAAEAMQAEIDRLTSEVNPAAAKWSDAAPSAITVAAYAVCDGIAEQSA